MNHIFAMIWNKDIDFSKKFWKWNWKQIWWKQHNTFFIHLLSQTMRESRHDFSFSPSWRCLRRRIFSPNLAIYRQISSFLARRKIYLESFIFHYCQREWSMELVIVAKVPEEDECILLCAIVGNGSRVVVTHQIFINRSI